MTDTITTKPFVSQAQQRFAFGTHQPWAKRWAGMTDFSTLPKRAKRLLVRRKALFAAVTKDWSPQARAAALAARRRNMLARQGQVLPDADARNLASARAEAARLGQVHHTPVAKPPKAPKGGKGGKGGGGKGGKAPKGKTPEQLAAAQQHERERLARDMERTRQQAQRAAEVERRRLEQSVLRQQRGMERSARQQAAAQRRAAIAERRAKLQKRGGGKHTTTTTSAAEQRAQLRFEQSQQDRRDRIARQQQLDAQRAQDRADRIAARREARVGRPRNNVVTSGAGTNRVVRVKAHAMSRDEEKAMFANLAKSGKLRRRARTAAVGGARKPNEEPQKPEPKTVGDTTKAFGADPNTSYTLRHELVDMKDIEASNTAGGGINPKYDPSLQPRDRSRASSQAQIAQVAQNMNPEVLTTDFHRIDAGSPIIDAKGNVLSGNGRTLALQRAAELHPDKYAEYKAAIKAEAAAHGIDPAAVDKMENPVLVRRLQGETDPAAFAREANSSGTLRMSPLEQAKVDAGQISDRHMLKLNVTEGQDIDRALRDPANKPFIHEFLSSIPENERANLLTRNGDLNQMGLYRAKAAIYTRAFPGESGERLAESMLESLDPEVKSIQNGISGGLPAFSHATALTRSGARDPSLDISDDLARTIDVYARIKDNPALTANTPASQVVAKYLGQSSMFDRELTPQQERLLVYIDKIARKPTEVRSFLDRYAKTVEDQPPPGQASLFGDAGGLTRAQLYDILLGDTKIPSVDTQAGMF